MPKSNSHIKLNVEKIRRDFPILFTKVNGKPLVYMDNAATSQKPKQVIDCIVDYYETLNANIHRGVHTLSQLATEKYENSRKTIQKHLNASKPEEIVFTSGVTHAMNLIANGMASILKEDDEVIVSELEHHSNIVPWQMMCERTGAKLKVLPMDETGRLKIEELDDLLNDKTKLVFVNHISNALGVINPIEEIIEKAHQHNAAVVIDGAQAGPHIKPDVQAMDVDFYVISGHKMCGPTGIGALYAKEYWLKTLPPYQGGGEMIDEVTFEKTTYADLPHKFEAGTPNISGGIALGCAIDYLNQLTFEAIEDYEKQLMEYASSELNKIEGMKIYADEHPKASVISFNIEGIHPYDIGTILDKMGIAVRTGHHCAQPIMDHFQIPGTVRASFAFYNTFEEIDVLVDGVKKAKQMLQ